MCRLVLIEGVSGVGKSTTAVLLTARLQARGFRVERHLEGESASPLDLFLVAYLPILEYETLLAAYPSDAAAIASHTLFKADYALVRYMEGRYMQGFTPLFAGDLLQTLRAREFAYAPAQPVPMDVFTNVFRTRWAAFATDADFAVMDGSLVSHMTNDLMRSYNADAARITAHIEALARAVAAYAPIVFYLKTNDIRGGLARARENRGQEPPTEAQAAFWAQRAAMDAATLPALSVPVRSFTITAGTWDAAMDEMEAVLTGGKPYGQRV